ncbi:hypothetical protein SESBI_18808 [Sesbania bispinosa]|nr:hypothetical protein SESBI_18808 [Sesbania bispinosa]
MTRKKGRSREGKLSRYMKAVMRLLSKARDLYVQGMSECSGHFAYMDTTMGFPTARLSTFPRSTSTDNHLKDLLSPASISTHGNHVGLELRCKHPAAVARVPRCLVAQIGRIDEDKPCEFGNDINVNPHIYPRSRCYAVHGRARVF